MALRTLQICHVLGQLITLFSCSRALPLKRGGYQEVCEQKAWSSTGEGRVGSRAAPSQHAIPGLNELRVWLLMGEISEKWFILEAKG